MVHSVERSKVNYLVLPVLMLFLIFISCGNDQDDDLPGATGQVRIDSITASLYSVKAWDTATITCYADGTDLVYTWECDHGNFNGQGFRIKYAAGECCVGINTITCIVGNETGHVSGSILIEVTSYFGGGK
jgi:hypothetical protein